MRVFRTLWRNPGFTIAVSLTLAVGIGANTAVFSFINGVYLRPLPYPEPERLVMIGRAPMRSYANWRNDGSFAAVGAWGWSVVTISGAAFPERVQVQLVAGDYFRALGVSPVGRGFGPDQGDCSIVVSRRLAAAPLKVDGAPCEIVGVMPDGWLPPLSVSARVEAWMPLAIDAGERQISILARLAPGATLEAARRHDRRAAYLKDQVSGRPNQALLTLAVVVSLLLLLACLNIATLLRARASGQRREIAIRAAMGASRRQLVGHVLAQTLALAAIGGAAGTALAYASLDVLVKLAHNSLPRLNEVRIDWRVLAFTAVLTLASGLLFGIGPAVGMSRADLRDTLAARSRRKVVRGAMAAAQIALAFVLLAGAGLLIRSWHAIRAVDLGFQTDRVLSANFALPPTRYAGPQRYLQFVGDVLSQVRSVRGVVSATATLGVPMRGSAGGKLEIYGRPMAELPTAEFRPGDESYFATLGMTIERGRSYDRRDIEGAPPVALVNQKLARDWFGGEDPIGKRIRMEGKPWMTVIGVVRDTRHVGPLRDTLTEIYVPFAQWSSTGLQPRALVVRTSVAPERLIADLQRAVAAVDKDQPLVSIGTLEQGLADFLAPQRFDTVLMTLFAALGLALASAGIFGVTSYGVARRTHEIGVRMAIGADRRRVLGMVLGETLRTAAAGLAIGWSVTWALGRLAQSLLFGVTTHDPIALSVASAVTIGVAMLAGFLPAQRASRIDPVAALRAE
jgi:putative ABC transport system permease protein